MTYKDSIMRYKQKKEEQPVGGEEGDINAQIEEKIKQIKINPKQFFVPHDPRGKMFSTQLQNNFDGRFKSVQSKLWDKFKNRTCRKIEQTKSFVAPS